MGILGRGRGNDGPSGAMGRKGPARRDDVRAIRDAERQRSIAEGDRRARDEINRRDDERRREENERQLQHVRDRNFDGRIDGRY